MSTNPVCADFVESDVIQRYVAGRSSPAETEAFELHLVGCRECQDAVRLGAALRVELPRVAATTIAPKRPRWALPVVGVAAAALLLAFLGERLDRRPIRDLGGVATAPPYAGVAVRATVGREDSLFEAGMRLYSGDRRAEALRALADARAAGADSTPTSFFIGVLHLLGGQPRLALRDLNVVTRRAESPYTAEAHFYAGKAWLQLARADSALARLDVAGRSAMPIAAHARALADSVREAQR